MYSLSDMLVAVKQIGISHNHILSSAKSCMYSNSGIENNLQCIVRTSSISEI
jgi:hypothetical protein